MINDIIPEQYIKTLSEGGMLVMIATPLDERKPPIKLGFNMQGVYEAKETTGRVWVSDNAIMDLPQATTPKILIQAMVGTIMKMTPAGGVMIDIIIAEPDVSVSN